MHKIDDSLPSIQYMDIIEQLKRNQASILTQLRTSHIPLNEILFHIKQADSADCPHCPGFKESIFHFLLIYPAYNNARCVLHTELGQKASSIPFLLGTMTGIPPLLRFISNTRCLKATFGEVRPDNDFTFKIKTKETTQTQEEIDDS